MQEKKEKPKSFPVYPDPELRKRLDDYCRRTGTNRNKLTLIALKKELDEREKNEPTIR